MKNHLVRVPFRPLPVKYSLLARKTTGLLSINGRKIESENERWLLARIAAPSEGILSEPRTQGLNMTLSRGPSTMFFSRKYHMADLLFS
jgi:hypothetical protein